MKKFLNQFFQKINFKKKGWGHKTYVILVYFVVTHQQIFFLKMKNEKNFFSKNQVFSKIERSSGLNSSVNYTWLFWTLWKYTRTPTGETYSSNFSINFGWIIEKNHFSLRFWWPNYPSNTLRSNSRPHPKTLEIPPDGGLSNTRGQLFVLR